MSAWLEAVILGIVQGLTEFLPISSSGHLEIVRHLLGDDQLGRQGLLMTVTLHAATAFAIIIVYRTDINRLFQGLLHGKKEESRYVLFIGLSMIPAVIIGLIFEQEIEGLFEQNMSLIAAMLVVTGMLLLASEFLGSGHRSVNASRALWIGLAQAIAILPGISRSGSTISLALLLGMDREKAARFSFLMVIPLIFGKMCKELLDGGFSSQEVQLFPLMVGAIASFVTGWVACKWVIAIVKGAKLHYFAIYCFIVAVLLWIC